MLLETKGLKKHFGGIKAVDGVDINIGEGEDLVGLIGPNGAGKTTFYNLVTGVISPDEGEIWYKGEDIFGKSPVEVFDKGIGRTWQTPKIFSSLTVAENMLFVPNNIYQNPIRALITPMSSINEEDEKLRERAYEILEGTGLYEKRDHYGGELNVGERKSLELSRVLMADPELVLADEPTAGLGDEDTRMIMDYLEEISEERTLVVIEHKMGVVMNISKRIIVLNKGKVLTEGSPKEVQENEEVRRVYLGR